MDEQNKYLEAYYQNEYDANKQMGKACLFTAIMLTLLWVGYLTRFFTVTPTMFIVVNIAFPVDIILLLTPLFYSKTKYIQKARYKYFVLSLFFLAVAVMNIVVPKHAILAWALPIVLTNHYYNPKIGKIVFFSTLFWMVACLYLGMLFGEYDGNLIGYGYLQDGEIVLPQSVWERIEMMNSTIKEDNRYLKVFFFYYVPRALIVTLVWFISNALNKRTYKLLVDEIKVNSEQEKVSTELNVAKEIQLNTLPNEMLTNRYVQMIAELKAARDVGGDFYDYKQLDNDHIAIVIGDVSGKGIPAAMFMMKAITCFKNFTKLGKKPSEILKEVNAALCEGNTNMMFATCFFGILDIKTGVMEFSNAGHNPPVIYREEKSEYLKCKPGFLLGGMEELFLVDESLKLQDGDIFLLYTDGITEAKNPENELYGEERFINFLRSKKFSCILEMQHEIKDDLAAFVNGREQSDDITYLGLKYLGDDTRFTEKLIKSSSDSVPEALEFLNGFVKKNEITETIRQDFEACVEEVVSNIYKYGYKEQEGDIYLRFLYNASTKEFSVTIINTSDAFDPLAIEKAMKEHSDIPEVKKAIEGVNMMREKMTTCVYDRINGKNILTLKKSIE